MASLHMQNSDDYRGGKSETSASVKEWTIFLGGRVSETHSEGEGQNTVVTLSVRLHNCKGCLGPFANTVQTAFKGFFYTFLSSAFKFRASLIHLNN